MRKPNAFCFALILFLSFTASGYAHQSNITDQDIFTPVRAENGMVVTSEPMATKIGVDVLKKGGNAVDAAVAVGFALAVTLPRAGNIGGGGFMMVYSTESGKVIGIDYREKAPSRAHRDMYLDQEGNVDTQKIKYSHLASGVPGTVAGLALALEKYGTMSLKELIEPAIELAEGGYVMTPDMSEGIKARAERFRQWESTREIFFKSDGSFYEPGDRFVQKDLAGTLILIAEEGPKAFYRGKIADLIAAEMQHHGGWITKEDLAGYKPIIREPVNGTYRGYDVYAMAPPSSGGVHIIQMLNILEGFDLAVTGHNSANTIHLMAEAMKRAYADRSKYLGDPDFVEVPVKGLTSKDYAASQRRSINPSRVRPSEAIAPGDPMGYECTETTHFSIVDKNGNVVSNTYTINFSYGSGIVVRGAGFLMNNEMDDFSAKPGFPNDDGLIGADANAIAPRKRMLSSMSPTIILNEGKPFLVTGSPGGSRIITTTLQIILNVIDHGMNVQEAVNASRMHHQWLPDEILMEDGFSLDTIRLLEGMGYTVRTGAVLGSANSILIDHESGILYGAADPRRHASAVGY